MDSQTRSKIFWLLKRLTSYSLWKKKRDAWEKFACAYEDAVKTWPGNRREQMPAENLPHIHKILSLYNEGLRELRQGNRSIWRNGGAFEAAIREYLVVSKFLYPDGDCWERGIQEAPYPPNVEILNILMRASEFRGEEAPVELIDAERKAAFIKSPAWLLNPDSYRFRFYELQYPVFPDHLPEPPAATDLVVRTGHRVPVDGVWEPVNLQRKRLLRLVPIGEAEAKGNGCFNYFVEGVTAPKINGNYNEATGRYEKINTRWRLVWKDDRYKDGTVPDESEYFIEPKQHNVTVEGATEYSIVRPLR